METKTKLQAGKMTQQVDPSRILNTGLAFFNSKALLTAVKMNLFTVLGKRPQSRDEIKKELNLNGRGLYDFLDSLVSMGFLNREGIRSEAIYSNAEDTSVFLDKNKPTYMGGILEMANNRLYPIWNNLELGLTTGKPQNEMKAGGSSLFEELYKDLDRTREFIRAMAGVQMGNFIAFAKSFDFSGYHTLCDIGGAGAHFSIQVVKHNPGMKCISLDLPVVSIIARENVNSMDLADKIDIVGADFNEGSFPGADVITLGNILHGVGTSDKKELMRKAYDVLPEGGALVAIENFIDNDRRENTFGLLMSLNMLMESYQGYDMTIGTFDCFAREVGFRDTRIMPLNGPTSAAIAVK